MATRCEHGDGVEARGAWTPRRAGPPGWILRRLGDAAIVAGALALAFLLIAVGA
ncbi:hypothetical protein [Methylobacterium planeticum]|uniref:hypothetical protein n=1 Tax=Methylobacterium planeticum TaxID=2615211 RepID=UPI001FEE0416|nr:hypothetical protein [Methylobacterium planeticum]